MYQHNNRRIYLYKDRIILCQSAGIGKVGGKEPSVIQAMKQKLEKMEDVNKS